MSDAATRCVAITGSSGYVGGLVAERYARAGWRVVGLSRGGQTSSAEASEGRRYVLGEPVSPKVLDGVDVLIHCAYDFSLTKPRDVEAVNVTGTAQLVDAAASAGVNRIVFVSSMSAYEGTTQIYGRAKLAGEARVAAVGGTSVRLGLVYGGGGGMAGALGRLVRLPVVPLVGARSHQFTVHQDDVAEGLFQLGGSDQPLVGTLGLAHPTPVPFRQLLEGFARHGGAHPRFVPIPWRPVYAGMRAAEWLHVSLPLRADSLLGLVRPAPDVPRVAEWAKLGVRPRAFDL